MTDYRTAIRRATLAAARLHRDLGIEARATRENGRVDVFEVAARLDDRTQTGEMCLVERRPWQPAQALSTFTVRYDLTGAEGEGLSRAERRYRLEAA